MKVPLLDLKAHHAPLMGEILEAIKGVAESNAFILGPQTKQLEASVAAYSNTRHAIGLSSGSDALLAALMALDLKPGDEVITPTYSFFATAGAVARLGAKPVLADIDLSTFNIDVKQIEKLITKKTRAIIPVHLYGQCADMKPILAIAAKHGLKVVEDAAQSIGAEYSDGKRAGSMGDIGCFSFFPSKNLGCWGDGGMVVAQNDALGEKLEVLRSHGSKPKYHHKIIGGNFRLDEIQSAVLNVKLKHLDSWTAKRQANAKLYTKLFRSAGLDKKGVTLPEPVYAASGAKHFHIYNQYVLLVPRRDEMKAFLAEKGIGSEIYYPVPFHMQECFRYLGYRQGDFPLAEKAASTSLALPIYPELTQEQQAYVVETIAAFLK
ncbi:MAG: DegT/DnrJ/EryC1/StrS family aminotransferase [Elusimicrobia bacterium]|nr:DegT/DnrJ/EryC1/StrS family aminotransferase [Elusimicrobiota bacterium]